MNNEESERIEDTLKLLDGLIKIEKEGGAKATITRSILTDLKIKKSLIKKTAESCDKKWRERILNVKDKEIEAHFKEFTEGIFGEGYKRGVGNWSIRDRWSDEYLYCFLRDITDNIKTEFEALLSGAEEKEDG